MTILSSMSRSGDARETARDERPALGLPAYHRTREEGGEEQYVRLAQDRGSARDESGREPVRPTPIQSTPEQPETQGDETEARNVAHGDARHDEQRREAEDCQGEDR
jgi:hypothetical protein